MTAVHALLAARYNGGSGYGDWLVFQWMWRRLGWWSLLPDAGFLGLCGAAKALFGGSDDDDD